MSQPNGHRRSIGEPGREPATGIRLGRVGDLAAGFRTCADARIAVEDVYLLGAKYPGETLPDGMCWGLKQLGLVFILSTIRRLGLTSILEAGAGFNFYLANRLGGGTNYMTLDKSDFYEPAMIEIAKVRLPKGRYAEGMLGRPGEREALSGFDACVSASVLEHVPDGEIDAVCADMAALVSSGGYALHSIDVPYREALRAGERWRDGLRAKGFELEDDDDLSVAGLTYDPVNPPVFEPLSIKARFYDGQPLHPWYEKSDAFICEPMITLLVLARRT